jgi:hypothetical protein
MGNFLDRQAESAILRPPCTQEALADVPRGLVAQIKLDMQFLWRIRVENYGLFVSVMSGSPNHPPLGHSTMSKGKMVRLGLVHAFEVNDAKERLTCMLLKQALFNPDDYFQRFSEALDKFCK